MTTEPTAPPTAADVRALFRWLVNVGLEAPRHHADPTGGPAAITEAADAYAAEMTDDGVTLPELRAAAKAYIRKPLAHGGRCPWPNAGTLIALVIDARVDRIPRWGDPNVGDKWEMVVRRAWSRPENGLDVSMVAEGARDLMAEAITEARAVQRRDEAAHFIGRDVERAYEARRMRRGGK